MSDTTLYEVRNRAAWITLNRPDNRNALSRELVNALYDHLQTAIKDPDVRAIVLTGAGPAFCAGADLKNPPGASVDGQRSVPLPDVLTAMMDSPKPVIAAINGAAFAGGLGLVGASDIVITRNDAQFSFSEVKIGVIPAMISVVCLPKLGTHHAMRLFLTGDRFSGDDAVVYGFAHRAVPENDLIPTVEAEVAKICQAGPNAVAETKKLVRRVPELSIAGGFAETAPWSQRIFQSDEAQEGMAAFREKRSPAWVTGEDQK